MGGNYFIENGLKNSRCWLSWYKMQEFSGADMELAWTSFNESSKTFKLSRVEFHSREKKLHPTMKPLELFRWCIDKFTKENSIIFDPFLGSGTTAVACKMLKRNYIGCEISKEYVEIAEQRIKSISNTLF